MKAGHWYTWLFRWQTALIGLSLPHAERFPIGSNHNHGTEGQVIGDARDVPHSDKMHGRDRHIADCPVSSDRFSRPMSLAPPIVDSELMSERSTLPLLHCIAST